MNFFKDNWASILISSVISILITAVVVALSFGGEVTDELATWLSALGTISAVIVSLYLANREKEPRPGKLKFGMSANSTIKLPFNKVFIEGFRPQFEYSDIVEKVQNPAYLDVEFTIFNVGETPLIINELIVELDTYTHGKKQEDEPNEIASFFTLKKDISIIVKPFNTCCIHENMKLEKGNSNVIFESAILNLKHSYLLKITGTVKLNVDTLTQNLEESKSITTEIQLLDDKE